MSRATYRQPKQLKIVQLDSLSKVYQNCQRISLSGMFLSVILILVNLALYIKCMSQIQPKQTLIMNRYLSKYLSHSESQYRHSPTERRHCNQSQQNVVCLITRDKEKAGLKLHRCHLQRGTVGKARLSQDGNWLLETLCFPLDQLVGNRYKVILHGTGYLRMPIVALSQKAWLFKM